MEKSIVKKMILMMTIIIVGGIGILFAGTKVMFDNTGEDVRIAYAKTQYGMIDSIFFKEKDILNNLIHDYAVWDDMYYSIETYNYEWSAENATRFLVDSNDGFELDMVQVLGTVNDYNEAYGKTEIIKTIEESHVYTEAMNQNKLSVDYIQIDNALYLVAICPVTTNNKRMTNGYYIMAKEYTQENISDLIAAYMNKDELFLDEKLACVLRKLNSKKFTPKKIYRRDVAHYELICYLNNITGCYLSGNNAAAKLFSQRARIYIEDNNFSKSEPEYCALAEEFLTLMENQISFKTDFK